MDKAKWIKPDMKRMDNWIWRGTLFIFFLQILLLFSPVREEKITNAYLIPLIVAMVVYLWMRLGIPRTPVMLLPVVFALWFLLCRVINGDWYLQESYPLVYKILLSCCVLFIVPFLTGADRRDAYFKAFAFLYSILFSVIAWIAVIAVLSGNNWVNPLGGGILGIDATYANPNRLNVLDIHPNISAIFFYTSLALLLYLFFASKRVWSKVLYIAAAIGLYLAICMTGSISSIGITGLILGCAVFAVLLQARGLRKLRIPVAVVAMLAICVLVVMTYPLVIQTTSGLYEKMQKDSAGIDRILVSTASAQENQQENPEAESEAPDVFVEERLEVDSMTATMQGRFQIYSSAFLAIEDRPVTLLIGELWQEAMVRSARVIHYPLQNHLHNSYLQTLVVGGGISVLLALLFTVLLVIYAIRLFFHKETPLYRKMLVLAPAGLLCHSMTESILFVDTRIPNMLFFLVAGMIIACAKEIKAKDKQAV